MSSPLNITSSAKLLSGYTIPLLGFGVYQNPRSTTKNSCIEAFKAGYRHVDSARMYRNEVEVGEAVRESGLDREKLFITTKIASSEHGHKNTLRAVDESLNRFGFDYIDLYLIHDPLSGKTKRLDTYKALLEAKKAGKIRTVGVSNFGVRHLEEIEEAGLELPAVNQIEIHPFCQQRPIVEYCQAKNIVVEAYCPIIQGDLDHRVFKEVARANGDRDPAQILLRWSLQKGFVPLPKSVTPSRIHSNTNLYDFELSKEDMDRLNALDKGADGAISWNPVEAP